MPSIMQKSTFLRLFIGHESDLTFSPRSTVLASALNDTGIEMWNIGRESSKEDVQEEGSVVDKF
jgi:hypothetical protein